MTSARVSCALLGTVLLFSLSSSTLRAGPDISIPNPRAPTLLVQPDDSRPHSNFGDLAGSIRSLGPDRSDSNHHSISEFGSF